MGYPAATGRRT